MKNKEEITQIFLMFQTIYLRKWTDCFPSVEILEVAVEQWRIGLSGIKNEHIQKAMDHCRINLIWPPSIAEFLTLCEKEEGVPEWEEAYIAAIRGEYIHSLVELTYRDIGSYAMTHDTEKALRKKFKNSYHKKLQEYRTIRNQLRLT